MSKYFLITSYGRSATFWLADALNHHPDILCSHGLIPYVEYGDRLLPEVILNNHKNSAELNRKTIDEFFDEMEAISPAKVYGNVHGYSVSSLTAKLAEEMPSRKMTVVNLTRHPILRIESLAKEWISEYSFSPYAHSWLSYWQTQGQIVFNWVKVAYPEIDLEQIESKAFLCALYFVIRTDAEELKNTELISVPMERLTKDIEYFSWLFSTLVQGEIYPKPDYLYEVISSKRKNVHADRERCSIEQFELWQEWQRYSFIKMLETRLVENYYNFFGYDLSFSKRFICNQVQEVIL